MSLSALDVLVADDHAFSRSIVVDIIRAHGIRKLRQASDGAEAFALFQRRSPDIVIADFDMPVTGLHLLRNIRTSRESPDREACVIVMTGHSDRQRIEALRDAGATEIIAKPLSVRSLMSRIVTVIDHPRSFINAPSYFGPDRRRRGANQSGQWRRRDDQDEFLVEIA